MQLPDLASHRARSLIGAERVAIAILGGGALVARFRWGLGSATFEPANFFAYLTVQSNAALVVLMAIAGVAALRGNIHQPDLSAVQGIALTCVVTSGIVYGVIVYQSSQLGIRIDVPWSDVVLHFVLPLLAIADWIFAPRSRPPLWIVVIVLGYVVVWGVLTIVRGAVVEWYPYYFLDPRLIDTPVEFVVMSGIALAVFTVVGVLLVLARPRRLVRSAAM